MEREIGAGQDLLGLRPVVRRERRPNHAVDMEEMLADRNRLGERSEQVLRAGLGPNGPAWPGSSMANALPPMRASTAFGGS